MMARDKKCIMHLKLTILFHDKNANLLVLIENNELNFIYDWFNNNRLVQNFKKTYRTCFFVKAISVAT